MDKDTRPAAAPAAAGEPGLAPLARFIAEQERKPVVVPVAAGSAADAGVLMVPDGYKAVPYKPLLDEFRLQPSLRAGTTLLTDLASFIVWTARHMDAGSMVYANDTSMTDASLTAIIDHDQPGAEAPETRARFGRHRATYAFPFSREWTEWTKVCQQGMSTADFAAFFERRIGDVQPPPYSINGQGDEVFEVQDPEIRKLVVTLNKRFATVSELVKLTRGIEINVDAKAAVRVDRDTGEHSIAFSEANGEGEARLKPPNAFLIAIPVLHNGEAILIAVHLRYRAKDGKVLWFLELHHPDRVFESVFTAALVEVGEKTGLPVLRGKAPAAR
jgi:hypothetical protein